MANNLPPIPNIFNNVAVGGESREEGAMYALTDGYGRLL